MQRLLQSRAPLRTQYSCLLHRNASTANVMSAAKIALNQVPLVDIAPLVHQRRVAGDGAAEAEDQAATPQQKAQILEQMKRACLETGFFTVPTKNVLSNNLITKVQPELKCMLVNESVYMRWRV